MRDLPTGTVTFLFTDIEGSTKLVQALGERYADVLAEHCRILRSAISDHRGTEIATEGDSFFAVFRSAPDALAATAAAQQGLASGAWPAGVNVRVRMGLHTGEGTLGGDNYIGLDVHRAARIAAAGHGGQVVVGASTRAAAGSDFPTSRLRDLGAHRLKDLAQPEHLYQLDVDGLPTDFPALRSLDARANNLPVQLTSFVGREADIATVQNLVDRSRLVTITGPGGSGKTRLALQVAAERLLRHGDGAFFVELAPVASPDMLPSAIADALHVREAVERPLLESILEALRDRDMLLVLDNFEHLQDAAPTVARLVAVAPNVRILVTSRARLNLRGEEEFAVPPLGIPDAAHLPTLAELSQFEGVGLFIERARSVRPDFEVTAASAPAIAEIVSRLDGLPLAIELAAAKTRIFTPEAILGRLGSRLAFLRGGARDLPARQQTLREAIDWSYQLIAAGDHQRALRWLGVFVGGFALSAGEALLSRGGQAAEAIDTLEHLADQSLLRRRSEEHGESRLSMLETIREFALERLAEAGEMDDARRRHAEVVLAAAEALEPQLASSSDVLDAMTHDHDNVRAALSWALETGEAELGLRLGYAAWRFWQRRGHFREARSWFDRLLALPAAAEPTPARAKGLTGAAGIAYWQNDYAAALAWYREAEDIVRTLGDRVWLADALFNTGETAALVGDMATVTARLGEGEAIGRELGDNAILGRFLQAQGYMAFMGDELEAARGPLEEALDVASRGTDPAAVFLGHHTVAQVARLQGRHDDAARHYREAIRLGFGLGDIAQTTEPLQGLAAVLIATGSPERGVRLLGANAAIRERLGGGPPPEWLRLGDPLAEARKQLDAAAYDRAWEEGLRLSDSEARATALEEEPAAAATAR